MSNALVKYVVYLFIHHEIYDIGIKILYKTCFGHNSAHKALQKISLIPVKSVFYVDYDFSIKTRFKAIFQKRPPWIRRWCFYGFERLFHDFEMFLTILKCFLMILKCCLIILKCFFNDLSSSLIIFVRSRGPVGEKTTKIGTYEGGRRP